MDADKPVKVAIVDDSKDIVDSLRSYLEYTNKLEVTCTANSGEEFIRKMKACETDKLPAVVITDINMPGMSGVDLVKHLKVTHPGLKFLMLTVNDDEDALFEAIRAGAEGYLMKDEKISTIADMTLSMMREGSIPMTSRIARKTPIIVDLCMLGWNICEKEARPTVFNCSWMRSMWTWIGVSS